MRLAIFLFNTILIFYALIIAREYLYPVFLGMLFAYLLLPIGKFLEKHHFARIPANFISIIIGIVVIAGAVFLVYQQIMVLLEDLPDLKQQASKNVNQIVASVNEYLGLEQAELKKMLNQRVNNLFDSSSDFVSKVFTATTGTVVKIGLMPVYVFLFLYYRTKIAVFILKLVPSDKKQRTINILRDIEHVTVRYMAGVFTVVAILCVLNSLGLYIIGIKYAVVLGIISALFNFIPYFGTLLGGIIPLTFAILTAPSPVYPLRVVVLFIIIQFIENNILTPNISGGAVKINPMVTIVSIVAAAMIWGIPGMFIIIPVMGMIKIVTEHIPETRPYAFLLGTEGTEKHSLNRENVSLFYQKIKRIFGK